MEAAFFSNHDLRQAFISSFTLEYGRVFNDEWSRHQSDSFKGGTLEGVGDHQRGIVYTLPLRRAYEELASAGE